MLLLPLLLLLLLSLLLSGVCDIGIDITYCVVGVVDVVVTGVGIADVIVYVVIYDNDDATIPTMTPTLPLSQCQYQHTQYQ